MMSTIPSTRAELVRLLTDSWTGLDDEIRRAGPALADIVCVDDWTGRELLAIRAWWSNAVVDWIEAGRRGEHREIPAPGYRWSETPRLNADIAASARTEDWNAILQRLEAGFEAVRRTIASLTDEELLDTGVYAWAGKWPLARWISINTARQFTTARSYIRRALRDR